MSTDNLIADADYGMGQKTLKLYLIGFILSLVLTVIPLIIVMKHSLHGAAIYLALVACALSQFFVQVICFLRLNASKQGKWNLMSFLFTIFIIAVIVGGSLWIMYNLNYNMMH